MLPESELLPLEKETKTAKSRYVLHSTRGRRNLEKIAEKKQIAQNLTSTYGNSGRIALKKSFLRQTDSTLR